MAKRTTAKERDKEARREVRPGGAVYEEALEAFRDHLESLLSRHKCVNGMRGIFFVQNPDEVMEAVRLGFVTHPMTKGNPERRPDRAAGWYRLKAKVAKDPDKAEALRREADRLSIRRARFGRGQWTELPVPDELRRLQSLIEGWLTESWDGIKEREPLPREFWRTLRSSLLEIAPEDRRKNVPAVAHLKDAATRPRRQPRSVSKELLATIFGVDLTWMRKQLRR